MAAAKGTTGKATAAKAAPRRAAAKTTAKPPVRKAPAARKPRADKGKGHASPSRAAAKAAADKSTPPRRERRSGPRLTAAAQSVRDSLMIQRRAQDWSWEAIAEEAGITPNAAMKAVKKRQESAPLALNMDPVRTVERIARGLDLSIGDFEAISAQATRDGEFAAATQAKKAANDAREKLIGLLQATGRMPHDLSALRHLMDVREIGTKMVDAMEGFRQATEDATALRGAQRQRALDAAAEEVIRFFEGVMGFDRDAELEEGDEDFDGAEEIDGVVV